MEKILKAIKRGIVGFKNHIVWEKQYKTIVAEPPQNNFKIDDEWYKKRRILMMVPHADDELISSYSILCNAEDLTVYYCGFTGSNKTDKNRNTRRKELLEVCSELGVKVIEGDGRCDNLEEIISQGNYDSILLPSIVDWHEEHRKISYLINEVCNNLKIAPTIFCYSVTVPNESPKEILCVPLSKEEQKMKYDLFNRIYVSQKFMPIERLKLNERINGHHSGCFAAETFLLCKFECWSKMVSQTEILERNKNSILRVLSRSLLSSLNDLVLIRMTSREYYKRIEEL